MQATSNNRRTLLLSRTDMDAGQTLMILSDPIYDVARIVSISCVGGSPSDSQLVTIGTLTFRPATAVEAGEYLTPIYPPEHDTAFVYRQSSFNAPVWVNVGETPCYIVVITTTGLGQVSYDLSVVIEYELGD